MKKLILGMVIALLLSLPVIADADEATQPVTFGILSANGVTYYIPDNKVVVVGVGLEVAKFYDTISLRAELGTAIVKESAVKDTYVGPGLGVSIPKLITMIGGTWIADKLNPSFNLAFLGNIDNMIKESDFDFNYSLGLNFIDYKF